MGHFSTGTSTALPRLCSQCGGCHWPMMSKRAAEWESHVVHRYLSPGGMSIEAIDGGIPDPVRSGRWG